MTDGTKADATELLLPSLLAMDVYHRDVLGLVGWVERPRPLRLDLAKMEAKPIAATCDGFRKGSTHPTNCAAIHLRRAGSL